MSTKKLSETKLEKLIRKIARQEIKKEQNRPKTFTVSLKELADVS